MVAEPPKTCVIGDLEFSQTEADQLIGMFNMPGWGHLRRILANHRAVHVDTLLGKAEPRTLQDLGIAQGTYGTCAELENLPAEARIAYDVFRKDDEIT